MKPKKKMSMYKEGGFNPLPDTSYQSSASKAARKNVAKKQKEQDMADLEFIRSLLRQSRHATLDGSKGEKFDVPNSSKKYNDGGKTNDIPYFLRKDYVEGGRRSAISADASSPYEKARDKRSMNYDRLAESATININEALSKGEMSKEEHGKAKKAIQKFKENKDSAMRESGYGRTPEEKKAQDRAIRRMKNKKAKGGMKVKKYQDGGVNATGETGRSKLQDFRDERRAIAEERAERIAAAKERKEEFQEQYRKRRKKQAKKDLSGLSFKSAGEAVINSPFKSRSQEQSRNDYRLQKRLAGMGVKGLTELFESEDYGNFVKPTKKQIEKFVAEYSKK